MKARSHFPRRSGFTLTEVIIAMSISTVIAGMAVWFMVEGARSSVKATNTTINDLSQWSIFTAISVDSRTANGMAIYQSFTAADMSDKTKRVSLGTVDPVTSKPDPLGNVLILSLGHQAQGSKKTIYDQITGYVYNSTTKTLRKFVYTVPAAEKGNAALNVDPATLEEILVNNIASFSMRKVADNLNMVDPRGVFLIRGDQSGVLTVESVHGDGNARAVSKKLIDASFFIRG